MDTTKPMKLAIPFEVAIITTDLDMVASMNHVVTRTTTTIITLLQYMVMVNRCPNTQHTTRPNTMTTIMNLFSRTQTRTVLTLTRKTWRRNIKMM